MSFGPQSSACTSLRGAAMLLGHLNQTLESFPTVSNRCHSFVHIVAGCFALLLPALPVDAMAQDPESALATFSELGLDSIRFDRSGTFYRSENADRAREAHLYHVALSAFARDSLNVSASIRLAVLNQEDWARLTPLPYGFPNNFGPPANIVMMPALRLPAGGADTVLIGNTRDLALLAHEGGHILTWSLMPVAMLDSLRVGDDRLSSGLRARFARFDAIPEWYWEFAATYLGIAYLRSQYPERAVVFANYLEALGSIGEPRYRSLDAWFEVMMTSRTDSGAPFVATAAGNDNFAWYQGVVGIIANHVYSSVNLEYLDQLRSLTAGDAAWTTIDLIEDLEGRSPGLVDRLNRLGVQWRE